MIELLYNRNARPSRPERELGTEGHCIVAIIACTMGTSSVRRHLVLLECYQGRHTLLLIRLCVRALFIHKFRLSSKSDVTRC